MTQCSQLQADQFILDQGIGTSDYVRDATTSAERRRAGRLDDVSAELIPLLRRPDLHEPSQSSRSVDDLEMDEMADGNAVAGIISAVAISVPLWAIIGVIGWVAWR